MLNKQVVWVDPLNSGADHLYPHAGRTLVSSYILPDFFSNQPLKRFVTSSCTRAHSKYTPVGFTSTRCHAHSTCTRTSSLYIIRTTSLTALVCVRTVRTLPLERGEGEPERAGEREEARLLFARHVALVPLAVLVRVERVHQPEE